MRKLFWAIVFVLSLVAIFVLISPAMEVYFGVSMPFTTINHEQFTFYGYDIPAEKQVGFMFGIGILLMLPARTIHLALIKLTK